MSDEKNLIPTQRSDLGPVPLSHWLLLGSGVAFLIWSAIRPYEIPLWFQEAGPAFVGWAVFIACYRRFRFTTLSYALAWFFSLILIYGAHYSYALTPLGNVFQDGLDLSRNHYDRFGHVFQGVIPAMLARELLLRTSPLKPGKWLFVLCCAMALAISACYEFVEWLAAVTSEADDFLGSQGDIWDAHWDMLLALLGAIISQLLLSKWQDRQLSNIVTQIK